MRPIMKRHNSNTFGMDPLAAALAHRTTVASKSVCNTNQSVEFNKIPGFVFDLHCKRMINTQFVVQPVMCIMNMCSTNTFTAHAKISNGGQQRNSADKFPRYLEVNKNAVMLHDIDCRWYALKEDSKILQSTNYKKKYDDADLDFAAIHREAQKYNDVHNLQVKLDACYLQCLLQCIILHLQDSWCKLSIFQRYVLCHIVRPHVNVFDQLMWFGYDCLIRSNDSELLRILEYEKIVHGIVSDYNNLLIENLAIDFGLNFSFIRDVVFACDIHFEGSPRKRMPYTKLFHN